MNLLNNVNAIVCNACGKVDCDVCKPFRVIT